MEPLAHYEFEWDDGKAQRNKQKHGVSFAEAKSCFEDVFALESTSVIRPMRTGSS